MSRHKWNKDDSDEEEETLVCFMALSNEVTNENFDYDSSFWSIDDKMPNYEELLNTFNELHDDMTSLYLKLSWKRRYQIWQINLILWIFKKIKQSWKWKMW